MARRPNDGMRRAQRQEEREQSRHAMAEEDRSNSDSEQSDEDLGTLVSNSGQSRSNNDGMYSLFWGSVYHD